MEQTSLTERNYFRQSGALLNGRLTLSKSESDIVYALLTVITKEDEDFKDYKFTKSELERKIGVKLDTDQLRKTARSLMSKVAELKYDKEDWEIFSLFTYFSYKNSVITCRFDKAMKPFYLQLQQYVLADLRHILPIKSEYSREMYFLLKERAKFGSRTFDVEELMTHLKVPKSLLNYADFKRKVLNQAKNDINKYTDLKVDFEEIKPIRKVTGVTFTIKKNDDDLKSFIEFIRELHTNELLYYSKDNRPLKCSLQGLLYYADDLATLDKTTAQKAWEFLYEKREKLLCFQTNLLD
jgi:plasmid replication initiation protein